MCAAADGSEPRRIDSDGVVSAARLPVGRALTGTAGTGSTGVDRGVSNRVIVGSYGAGRVEERRRADAELNCCDKVSSESTGGASSSKLSFFTAGSCESEVTGSDRCKTHEITKNTPEIGVGCDTDEDGSLDRVLRDKFP